MPVPTRSRSRLAWPLACGTLLFAGHARAIPSAANSNIPAHALLVGRSGALGDTAAGAFTVIVRDIANNPVEESTVEFRVLNCPGARVASEAYVPGQTIRCGTHGFQAVTNFFGEVRMTLVGGGDPSAPPSAGPCAQVFASGVLLGLVTLAVFDLDGSGGLGSNDVSLWLEDLGRNEGVGRSDYDGDGVLTPNDLSIWLAVWGAAESNESPASYCP